MIRLVEATGIEPVSENQSMQGSTSVVYLLEFPNTSADKQADLFSSSITILRCEQAAESFTTA